MEEFLSVFLAMGTGGVVLVSILAILAIIKSLWHVCGPNEILIFSGRKSKWPDGSERGFRVVQGGGLKMPIIEKVDKMSLNIMEVPINIRAAFSKGGIALNVDAIANVKVSSDLKTIGNAIERFLNTEQNTIRKVAKETLEGHLRGVLARLTPEEVNEDRLKFAEELAVESEHDLNKLGIHLDTLKIQHVSDDRHYLDSIGRGMIAEVVKTAQIAESDAEREAELAEAENRSRASVAQANVEANISRMRNEVRKIKAELDSKVRSEEERTAAAAREARALAEQELQSIRVTLEGIRLQVEQIIPAEINLLAKEHQARGDAAILRERGIAMSHALDTLNTAWVQAGDAALSIFLIEDIEKILAAAALGVQKVHVEKIQVIDGGDGKLINSYIQSYPDMLNSVLASVKLTTGIDISKALASTAEETVLEVKK